MKKLAHFLNIDVMVKISNKMNAKKYIFPAKNRKTFRIHLNEKLANQDKSFSSITLFKIKLHNFLFFSERLLFHLSNTSPIYYNF